MTSPAEPKGGLDAMLRTAVTALERAKGDDKAMRLALRPLRQHLERVSGMPIADRWTVTQRLLNHPCYREICQRFGEKIVKWATHALRGA